MGADCFGIFTSENLNFTEARDYCRGEEGRDLASFSDEYQMHYVLSQLCNITDMKTFDQSLWIGLKVGGLNKKTSTINFVIVRHQDKIRVLDGRKSNDVHLVGRRSSSSGGARFVW